MPTNIFCANLPENLRPSPESLWVARVEGSDDLHHAATKDAALESAVLTIPPYRRHDIIILQHRRIRPLRNLSQHEIESLSLRHKPDLMMVGVLVSLSDVLGQDVPEPEDPRFHPVTEPFSKRRAATTIHTVFSEPISAEVVHPGRLQGDDDESPWRPDTSQHGPLVQR